MQVFRLKKPRRSMQNGKVGKVLCNPAIGGRSCFCKNWRCGKMQQTQHWRTLLELAYGLIVANQAIGGCSCFHKSGVQSRCSRPSNWWTPLLLPILAYGQTAVYSDELGWLSRQVSGPEDPAEPRAGTPHEIGKHS